MRVPERAVWQDTAVVVLATAIMTVLSVQFDLSEALRRWTAPWERFQLDELPAVLVVLAAGLAWFAARRYRDAGRELRRRKLAEAQLEAALADNRRLSQQYVRLQEAERKSLARELHDELGQYLNVIKLDAVGIRDRGCEGGGPLHERAEAIVANCNHIHAALTALLRQLRPVGLDDLGLGAALEHCVDTWRSRVPHMRFGLELVGELDDLDEALTVTVYRLVQEGLNNVAKHSSAQHVTLRVVREKATASGQDRVGLILSDDGVGADMTAPIAGLGLVGMRERVAALRGRLEVTSARGKGFQLSAQIPVEGADGPAGAADARGGAADARGGAADARGGAADARGGAADARGGAADARGGAADARAGAADARSGAADVRGDAAAGNDGRSR